MEYDAQNFFKDFMKANQKIARLGNLIKEKYGLREM